MAERLRAFDEFRERGEERVLDYLASRSGKMATVSDVRSFCRMASMSGMTEAILEWLEKRGAVTWERDADTVYLNKNWHKPSA